jgi:hypothetical protein
MLLWPRRLRLRSYANAREESSRCVSDAVFDAYVASVRNKLLRRMHSRLVWATALFGNG